MPLCSEGSGPDAIMRPGSYGESISKSCILLNHSVQDLAVYFSLTLYAVLQNCVSQLAHTHVARQTLGYFFVMSCIHHQLVQASRPLLDR